MISTFEWGPSALGLSGKDLKAANGTAYAGPILDVSQFVLFLFNVTVVKVGAATVGAVKLTMQLYNKDRSVAIGDPVDLLTAIGTTANRNELMSFGIGAGGKFGNGTLGTTLDVLRGVLAFKPILTVVTQSDAATSCVGSLRILARS